MSELEPMPADDKKAFGKWLRAVRQAAGKTQEWVGNYCGVERTQVNKWENGQHMPSTPHLIAIFEACGVRLVAGTPPPATGRAEPQTEQELLQAVRGLQAEARRLTELIERRSQLPPPGEEPGADQRDRSGLL